jgi:hypothetical protein
MNGLVQIGSREQNWAAMEPESDHRRSRLLHQRYQQRLRKVLGETGLIGSRTTSGDAIGSIGNHVGGGYRTIGYRTGNSQRPQSAAPNPLF